MSTPLTFNQKQPAKKLTTSAKNLKAKACNFSNGIYLDRSIGLESILMTVLLTSYVIWDALK